MSNAELPERVWIEKYHHGQKVLGVYHTEDDTSCPEKCIEYIRADLVSSAVASNDTWATVESTCGFCGNKVRHVCTAFLKASAHAAPAPSEDGAVAAARPTVLPPTPKDELDEVDRHADVVVEAAIAWHESGQEGGDGWFEASERLTRAIDSLLAIHSASDMPRRWCSVHNREEFKYESLEHELDQPSRECFCGTELEAGLCPNGHDPATPAVPSAQPDYRGHNQEALERFRDFAPNWDSYNGRPIDPKVIEIAQRLIEILPEWQVVPRSDGGIQFDGPNGQEINIDVAPSDGPEEPK